MACFLFGAGQDTSARLLGFAFRILGDHPDIQERLRSEPERIPDFIEEVLRFEPPVKVLSRLALRDVDVGGVTVPKGSIISIGTVGANRDPRHFDNPDTFDYHRRNMRDGLAFSKGAHGCIGAPLARMEARVAMEHFLKKPSISGFLKSIVDRRTRGVMPTSPPICFTGSRNYISSGTRPETTTSSDFRTSEVRPPRRPQSSLDWFPHHRSAT